MAADALFVNGGVTDAREARLGSGALIAVQGTTALDARTGVMFGPGTTTLVTGTSATAPMAYAIAVHHAVTSRGSSNGPYIGPTLDAATTATTTAAPASGSRIDVIYVKQQDSTAGIPTPDGSTGPLYAVVQGSSSTGTPVKPALPVGAEELATATVTSSATATNGAGVTITNTARQTVSRGAPIPVRSQAERDVLLAYPGLSVKRLDLGGQQEDFVSGSWRPVGPDRPWVTLVSGDVNYNIGATASWVTLPTMSASVTIPAGRTLDVEFKAPKVEVPVSGGAFLRLVVNAAIVDGASFQTNSVTGFAIPGRLTGSMVGTGGSVPIEVQLQGAGGGGYVKGEPIVGTGPSLRYRIF